jgi:hypothetical protein
VAAITDTSTPFNEDYSLPRSNEDVFITSGRYESQPFDAYHLLTPFIESSEFCVVLSGHTERGWILRSAFAYLTKVVNEDTGETIPTEARIARLFVAYVGVAVAIPTDVRTRDTTLVVSAKLAELVQKAVQPDALIKDILKRSEGTNVDGSEGILRSYAPATGDAEARTYIVSESRRLYREIHQLQTLPVEALILLEGGSVAKKIMETMQHAGVDAVEGVPPFFSFS